MVFCNGNQLMDARFASSNTIERNFVFRQIDLGANQFVSTCPLHQPPVSHRFHILVIRCSTNENDLAFRRSPYRFKILLTVALDGGTGHSRCFISRRMASAPCSPSGLSSLSCFRNVRTQCSTFSLERLTGFTDLFGWSFQLMRSSRFPLA